MLTNILSVEEEWKRPWETAERYPDYGRGLKVGGIPSPRLFCVSKTLYSTDIN